MSWRASWHRRHHPGTPDWKAWVITSWSGVFTHPCRRLTCAVPSHLPRSNNKASTVRPRSRTDRPTRDLTRTNHGMKTRIWKWRIFRIRTSGSWIAVSMASLMVSLARGRSQWPTSFGGRKTREPTRAPCLAHRKRRTFPRLRHAPAPIPIPHLARRRRQSRPPSRRRSTYIRSSEQVEQGEMALRDPVPIPAHRGHARDLQHPPGTGHAVETETML